MGRLTTGCGTYCTQRVTDVGESVIRSGVTRSESWRDRPYPRNTSVGHRHFITTQESKGVDVGSDRVGQQDRDESCSGGGRRSQRHRSTTVTGKGLGVTGESSDTTEVENPWVPLQKGRLCRCKRTGSYIKVLPRYGPRFRGIVSFLYGIKDQTIFEQYLPTAQ